MDDLREQYEKANALGKLAFAERPRFGFPSAPAQAETNAGIRAQVVALPFIRQQRAKNLAA